MLFAMVHATGKNYFDHTSTAYCTSFRIVNSYQINISRKTVHS